MGFNLIYWTPICGKTFLDCSILEKCGKIWKNGRFSGRLRPDWGHIARAATAGLGSKGLMTISEDVGLMFVTPQIYISTHAHFNELLHCTVRSHTLI